MTQIIPKKGWVIRTSKGLPVVFDPNIQLDVLGRITMELIYPDKKMAELLLERYSADVKAMGYKETFKLVEVELDPDDIKLALTQEDIHRKAQEERGNENAKRDETNHPNPLA